MLIRMIFHAKCDIIHIAPKNLIHANIPEDPIHSDYSRKTKLLDSHSDFSEDHF